MTTWRARQHSSQKPSSSLQATAKPRPCWRDKTIIGDLLRARSALDAAVARAKR